MLFKTSVLFGDEGCAGFSRFVPPPPLPTHGKEGKERIEIRRLSCCVFTCEVNFRPEFRFIWMKLKRRLRAFGRDFSRD